MAYLAFYRTFRPVSFDTVVRQEHIVRTLKNQIADNKIGHAYLFCGPRGTGKTSLAKIFARAINCENPQDGSPCGKCKTCISLSAGGNLDISEIDAASNNGVDEMRDLREKVQYPPVSGKYKVYIIDEVHMLTDSAFNALLKTLEEPPSYVIFILATTEVHKIPITILSRCQRYDFRRITIETISNRLRELMDKESVLAEERALKYIAKQHGYQLRTVEAAVEVNASQKTVLFRKASQRMITFAGLRVAVLGLAFKPGTDDLREAPSLDNVELLLAEGAELVAYDPVAAENFKKKYPAGQHGKGSISYVEKPADALAGAHICFVFTEWQQIKAISPEEFLQNMEIPLVYDGRNLYDKKAMREAGVEYYSIGR